MSKQVFDLMRVRIFISGSVRDSGKVGGFSAQMIAGSDDMEIRRTLSGYGFDTSATRMQLKAVETALLSIKAKQDKKLSKDPNKPLIKPMLEFYTTNAQVSAGLNKNVFTWAKADWKTKKGEVLQHADLWQNIFYLLENHTMSHRVHLVKDHADDTLMSVIRHSLFIADNNAVYSLDKQKEIIEESVVNGNISR